jgi:hypothetical protein
MCAVQEKAETKDAAPAHLQKLLRPALRALDWLLPLQEPPPETVVRLLSTIMAQPEELGAGKRHAEQLSTRFCPAALNIHVKAHLCRQEAGDPDRGMLAREQQNHWELVLARVLRRLLGTLAIAARKKHSCALLEIRVCSSDLHFGS